jgi:hypothetical protein
VITSILSDNPAFSIFFFAIFASCWSISKHVIIVSVLILSLSLPSSFFTFNIKFAIKIAEYPCKVPISSIRLSLYFLMISPIISPFKGPIDGRDFFLAVSSISDKTFNTFFF